MAVAVDSEPPVAPEGSLTTSVTVSVDVTTAADKLVVIAGMFASLATNRQVASVARAGQSFTEVTNVAHTTGNWADDNDKLGVSLWWLDAPNTGTADLTVTTAADDVGRLGVGVIALTGTAVGAPSAVGERFVVDNTANASTLIDAPAGSIVIDGISFWDDDINHDFGTLTKIANHSLIRHRVSSYQLVSAATVGVAMTHVNRAIKWAQGVAVFAASTPRLHIGSGEVAAVKLGSSSVDKLMLGGVQVFPPS